MATEVIDEEKGEGSLIGLLCSRNARPRKGLAREKARLGALRAGWVEYCAQWETDSGYPLWGGYERAWRDD